MSQPVFFAHANGFPSATYGKLFRALGTDYAVDFLEQHGHDPRFPVNDNWEQLVSELIFHLQQRAEPVWGVGHSLGGVLHYHAALRHPELYRGVVMLDSPLLTLADKLVIRAAKHFGFIDRITPAGRTIGRRERFADAGEARDYFAGKTLFSRFDPECLDDYVAHGLQASSEGLALRFDAQTEISIYRSVPHTSPGKPQQLQVPLAMVRGRNSRVVMAHHGRLLRRVPQGEYLSVPGGHMFPLERPQDTAELLRGLFKRWSQEPQPV
jgi:pimeloyl-ACP methyl ester carboxylesterase